MNVTVDPERCHLTVDGKPHISLAAAQRRLGISRMTAYRWMHKGKLPSVLHEGLRYCPESEVIRLEVQQENQRKAKEASHGAR